VRRTVTCSLRLDDWEDAWQRVDQFRRRKVGNPTLRNRWHYWNEKDEDAAKARRAIEHFELVRGLLTELVEHLPPGPAEANAVRRRFVTAAHIETDFSLMDYLLGDGFDTRHTWARDNDWWWAASDPLERARQEPEESWDWRETGVPLGPEGRPRLVTP